MAEALVAIDQRGLDVDQRRLGRAGGVGVDGAVGVERGLRHRAHGRNAIRPTGDDPGRGGIGDGGLAAGEGPRLILAAHGLGRVVVDQVEFDEGIAAEAVVPLGAQAALPAVVEIVGRAVVPDEGGTVAEQAVGGLLIVALGAVEAEGVFAVEGVDGDGEIFALFAEDREFLRVGRVEQSVVAAGFPERHLLGKPRRHAGSKVVVEAALFPHVEG